MRGSAWPLAGFAALALCGCNQDAPVASAPAPPPQASPAADFSDLPPGAACTDEINRYQSVILSDYRTGNANQSVFIEIEHELTAAAAACSAGQDGEALSLVHASEKSHGYHV